MKIFCENCRQTVGQVADEKIPPNKRVSTKCPKCGSKILLSRGEEPASPPTPAAPEMPPLEMENKAPPDQPESAADEVVPQTPPPLAPHEAPAPHYREPPGSEPPPPSPEYEAGYDFSIAAIIKEAWQKTRGAKGPLWGGMILYLVASMILSWVVGFLGGGDTSPLGFALQMTLNIALYPILTGVIMLGIRRSVDLPISSTMVFDYFKFMVPIFIAALLITIFTVIGFMLLVLPGIYLTLAYIFALPLIAERRLGAWPAMELSRKAITRRWFKIFGLYLVMAIIMLISMIPFGIGLIWTMPMTIVMGGILYRTIFGVREQ